MNAAFFEELENLEREKGIKVDYMLERIAGALVTAYKKDNVGIIVENVYVDYDAQRKVISMYGKKEVVDIVEDPITEVSLEDAREVMKQAEYGDIVSMSIQTKEFGRIAAQTAKQVIIQAIREAERGMIAESFSSKEHEILQATVLRVDPRSGNAIIEMITEGEKVEGILTIGEQVRNETLDDGDHIKVYVVEVKKATKGPQVIISRTHPGLVKRLFEIEVPEISDGIVEIKSIAREAGNRTKMAVYSNDTSIDPIGACVGNSGTRVAGVVDEINGEKIDIIKYSDDIAEYVSAALAPATIVACKSFEETKNCIAIVPDDQLSLAIGKGGQNARLAAKLTGCKIDIKPQSQVDLADF